MELKATLEAILFASSAPVELERLEKVLQLPREDIIAALEEIRQDCTAPDRGLVLSSKGENYRFITKKELGQTVATYLATRRTTLSNAAMETLAIAAYNQPVTKTYISQIRGVSSAEIVETLVEKGLLAEDGKIELPGRPMGYVTTDKFLTVFGLESLADLPEAAYLTEGLEEGETAPEPERQVQISLSDATAAVQNEEQG